MSETKSHTHTMNYPLMPADIKNHIFDMVIPKKSILADVCFNELQTKFIMAGAGWVAPFWCSRELEMWIADEVLIPQKRAYNELFDTFSLNEPMFWITRRIAPKLQRLFAHHILDRFLFEIQDDPENHAYVCQIYENEKYAEVHDLNRQ